MNVVTLSLDRVTVELQADELGLVSDVLGQALGYQDRPTLPPEPWLAEALERLYSELNRALGHLADEDERRSGPFQAGESVIRVLDSAGARLEEAEPATVVSDNAPDQAHDYPWVTVRLAGGTVVELPSEYVRRSE